MSRNIRVRHRLTRQGPTTKIPQKRNCVRLRSASDNKSNMLVNLWVGLGSAITLLVQVWIRRLTTHSLQGKGFSGDG